MIVSQLMAAFHASAGRSRLASLKQNGLIVQLELRFNIVQTYRRLRNEPTVLQSTILIVVTSMWK